MMRFELPIDTMSIVLGQHVRCGVEDNLWGRKGERATTLQQIETLKPIPSGSAEGSRAEPMLVGS